jgi:hypothetical protein
MIISHRLKYVFIHVPKTGGTAIESLLKDKEEFKVDLISHWQAVTEKDFEEKPFISRDLENHVSAKKLREYFETKGWNWDEYFKFAFVRNPWDLCVSQFFYWMQTLSKTPTTATNKEFIEAHVGRPPQEFIKKRATFDFMNHFVCDEDKNIIVDYIGFFEDLENNFNSAIQFIDPSFNKRYELRRINVSNRHKDYKVYYDEETKEAVEKAFYRTIRFGNYEFEGARK